MAEQVHRKPHEFSGGQQQRIGLARALILNPDVLVLDEPISALDVSIQAQILNVLREIQSRLDLTYLFIVHDLAVAEYFCDRIAVLYLGAVVETGNSETLFREPLHPYTVSLLSAAPIPDPESERRRTRIVLEGEVTPVGPESTGCRFQSRCPVGRGRPQCGDIEPVLTATGNGHQVACHFPGELRPNGG
jgi:oligopeptide/dipeptide ABC transporter ATP-binding protein